MIPPSISAISLASSVISLFAGNVIRPTCADDSVPIDKLSPLSAIQRIEKGSQRPISKGGMPPSSINSPLPLDILPVPSISAIKLKKLHKAHSRLIWHLSQLTSWQNIKHYSQHMSSIRTLFVKSSQLAYFDSVYTEFIVSLPKPEQIKMDIVFCNLLLDEGYYNHEWIRNFASRLDSGLKEFNIFKSLAPLLFDENPRKGLKSKFDEIFGDCDQARFSATAVTLRAIQYNVCDGPSKELFYQCLDNDNIIKTCVRSAVGRFFLDAVIDAAQYWEDSDGYDRRLIDFTDMMLLFAEDPKSIALGYRKAIEKGFARIFQDLLLSSRTYNKELATVDDEFFNENSPLGAEERETIEASTYKELLPQLEATLEKRPACFTELSTTLEKLCTHDSIFDFSINLLAIKRHYCEEFQEIFLNCLKSEGWNCIDDARNEILNHYVLEQIVSAKKDSDERIDSDVN